jgi:hypothetical protein
VSQTTFRVPAALGVSKGLSPLPFFTGLSSLRQGQPPANELPGELLQVASQKRNIPGPPVDMCGTHHAGRRATVGSLLTSRSLMGLCAEGHLLCSVLIWVTHSCNRSVPTQLSWSADSFWSTAGLSVVHHLSGSNKYSTTRSCASNSYHFG